MRFAIVGSGSKGNSLVVQSGDTTLLIDCGYAPRELRRRLESLEVDARALRGICITHGHGDHVKGARVLASSLGIITYATEGTQRFCARLGGLQNHAAIDANSSFQVGALRVTAAATSHDAPGSVCFVIDDGCEALGLCTDLGEGTPNVARALHDVDALVLEFNHDMEMLRNGPYTAHLKRRIACSTGHLSNEDAAALLAKARGTQLSRVLLAHLSEVNNTPALALAAARSVVDGADIEVAVAPQHHPTGWLAVRRRGPKLSRSERLVERLSERLAERSLEGRAEAHAEVRVETRLEVRIEPRAAAPVENVLATPAPRVDRPVAARHLPALVGSGRRHIAAERQLKLFGGDA